MGPPLTLKERVTEQGSMSSRDSTHKGPVGTREESSEQGKYGRWVREAGPCRANVGYSVDSKHSSQTIDPGPGFSEKVYK